MKHLQGVASAILTLTFAVAVGFAAWWLVTNKPVVAPADKPTPAASVGKVVKDEDFNTVTLTEEAEKRIGLTVAAVERKSSRRKRVYGGEIAVPAGRSILVAAPLSGTLRAPAAGEIKAGQSIKAGSSVFHLTPLLTPDARANLSASLAEAEGQVNNAKTQLNLTKIALERAKRVLKEGAGSQRQVDEADAANNLAVKTLDAAISRQEVLKKVVGDAEAGTVATISIEAPENGILRTISALPGQTVPAGAALFEVIDLSVVWVRVPLPVGDMDAIDRATSVDVAPLTASFRLHPSSSSPSQANAKTLLSPTARPVVAPPSANPVSATVDLFYEMPNRDGKLIPGQRLGVWVPLLGTGNSLTVPWSAVVFDIHGGTWVYEQIGTRKYTRRRVDVAYTLGADAVLASGPSAGANVVTAGVQELLGVETGFVK